MSFLVGKSKRATDLLELVHADLCGPMRIESLRGSKYFLLFIDDYSRIIQVKFLQLNSETFRNFNKFKALVEKQSGKDLKNDKVKSSKNKIIEVEELSIRNTEEVLPIEEQILTPTRSSSSSSLSTSVKGSSPHESMPTLATQQRRSQRGHIPQCRFLVEDGNIKKYKTRFIVREFTQQQGVYYEESFVMVSRFEAVRMLLALAAQKEYITLEQKNEFFVTYQAQRTWGYGIANKKLTGFVDSDWTGAIEDWKSTSKSCFILGTCVLSWNSKKQETVAL
nr:retrovirus-related Pol polyprotein from transposon TNT 1-94 [Tanacetum cinerariifolium]